MDNDTWDKGVSICYAWMAGDKNFNA